ncbi:oxidoreductase [Janibacter indicus]|uniref:Oxidoreductase n=1 Tax=Janibacter indicus TaxID=857417 RepID=A0A1L3MHI2_9MICO|nr:2-oxoglutarate and iron-dependent oxygenase domain-containing protein [Janibacter indicus]APH01716.1 oxidoreductase [Janibacter indicus]
MSHDALPVLDLADLHAGPEAVERFREQLRVATHEVGFFHLRHGIDRAVVDELFATARAFFALPEEDKRAIEMTNSAQFRGWTRLGGELTQGQVDYREQIDIGPERPLRDDVDPPYLRLDGPNQWPAALPQLRTVIEAWTDRLGVLGRDLMAQWALSLGAPADHFTSTFDDASTLLKIVRYPGTEQTSQGVGDHKDPGFLTLLLIEPGKSGLQVQTDGGWIDVPPTDDCFVVNIGELMEAVTDGYLRATSHRVTAPAVGSERLSIPFFFNPALDAEAPVVPLRPEYAERARGVTQDAANVISTRYGDNLLKARLRAHPDVAARHHADLVGGAG